MDWEELDNSPSNIFFSLFIGFVITLFFLSNAGQYIAEDELLNGSLITNGRYAITYDGYNDITNDNSESVVSIGSSIMQYAMDGKCMTENSKIENSKFYNFAMMGSNPYVEMVQIPTLIESAPVAVMIEIGPNSLWGWDNQNHGLSDYYEMRFTLSSMQMNHDLNSEWYEILEQQEKNYFPNTSIQRYLQWSAYTRDAIDVKIETWVNDLNETEGYFTVPTKNSKEWDNYLQLPKFKWEF